MPFQARLMRWRATIIRSGWRLSSRCGPWLGWMPWFLATGVKPRLEGWWGLPWILVGSWLSGAVEDFHQ